MVADASRAEEEGTSPSPSLQMLPSCHGEYKVQLVGITTAEPSGVGFKKTKMQ